MDLGDFSYTFLTRNFFVAINSSILKLNCAYLVCAENMRAFVGLIDPEPEMDPNSYYFLLFLAIFNLLKLNYSHIFAENVRLNIFVVEYLRLYFTT